MINMVEGIIIIITFIAYSFSWKIIILLFIDVIGEINESNDKRALVGFKYSYGRNKKFFMVFTI